MQPTTPFAPSVPGSPTFLPPEYNLSSPDLTLAPPPHAPALELEGPAQLLYKLEEETRAHSERALGLLEALRATVQAYRGLSEQLSAERAEAYKCLRRVDRIVSRYGSVEDPIVASDGFTYERGVLERYLEDCERASQTPVSQQTKEPLERTLYPNASLKKLVDLLKGLQLASVYNAGSPTTGAGSRGPEFNGSDSLTELSSSHDHSPVSGLEGQRVVSTPHGGISQMASTILSTPTPNNAAGHRRNHGVSGGSTQGPLLANVTPGNKPWARQRGQNRDSHLQKSPSDYALPGNLVMGHSSTGTSRQGVMDHPEGGTPPHTHPCLRIYGRCNYGERCVYAPYPYEVCLSNLKGKCRLGARCPEPHQEMKVGTPSD